MDQNLITNRRREVEAEIERLKLTIGEYEAELAELDTVERVMARLSGAKRVATGPANQQQPTPVQQKAPVKEPPLTEKIVVVVAEAHRRGLKGLEPKEIYDAIVAKGWTADLSAVRSTTWRIWNKHGRLSKPDPDSPLYSVPEREKATDLLSGREQSEAFDHQPEQGREAGPGGGT
jgi:hypothetical protein